MSEHHTLQLAPDLAVPIAEAGEGRPVLVLHGGGGPGSVAPLVSGIARRARVIAPTHPGWDGTEMPAWLHTVSQLADAYLQLLAAEHLSEVLVVGSSIGGWLAADMATRDGEHRISALVLIDAAGIEVPGEPVRDFFALDARGVAEYAYHDGSRFYVDPATLPPEQVARQRGNLAALRILAGDPSMHEPGLLRRLSEIRVPTLVMWGASDRIITPAYGRAYAQAIPGARYVVIPEAGHLPYLEQPEAAFRVLEEFIEEKDGEGVPNRP
jgi:pimeloyl-ACP methyl ester carboxylesterase